MDMLEVADPIARADIEKIKNEQLAQSALIHTTEELCRHNTKRLDETLPEYQKRITELEQWSVECSGKHETHTLDRRKSDKEMITISATLQETLKVNQKTQDTMNKLLKIVEDHAPTVKRARDSYTWWDKTRELLVVAAVIYGGIQGAEQIVMLFK